MPAEARSKCLISALDMEKELKRFKYPPKVLCLSEMEDIATEAEGIITTLMRLTPRVNKKLLEQAVVKAWDREESVAKMWTERILAAMLYIKDKGRKSTTGKRTSEVVRRIYKAVMDAGEPYESKQASEEITPVEGASPVEGGKAEKRGRRLKKHISLDSSGAPPSPPTSTTRTSRDDIMALYAGTQAAPTTTAPAPPRFSGGLNQTEAGPISLDSDTDEEKSKATKASPVAQPLAKVKQYLDTAKLCVVRVLANGDVLQSEMKEGPDGFAIAKFPNEEAFPTQIPNLLLSVERALIGRI